MVWDRELILFFLILIINYELISLSMFPNNAGILTGFYLLQNYPFPLSIISNLLIMS